MSASATKPRILVVDDERDNRELLAIVLRWEDFVVVTAAGGEEALAMVAHEPPDLILLDIMMPGMTGYEVVAKLRAEITTRHIPVILVTAMEDPDTRARALRAGADGFLAKPVARGELLSLVRAVLKETPERSGPQARSLVR